MNHEYKNSGRNTKTERDSRASSAVQLRTQKRSDMLQKKRTGTIAKGPSAYNISEMAEKISSTNIKEIIEGAAEFRRLLSAEKSPPIDSVVMSGLIPLFVKLTHPENPMYQCVSKEDAARLMHESAWVLTNIAAGNTNQTKPVVMSGGAKSLTHLLQVDSEELQDQAVWALGNISGDCEETRDAVLKEGAGVILVEMIKKLLNQPNKDASLLKNAAWALSNMNRGRMPPPSMEHMSMSLDVLLQLVEIEEADIMADGYWALSYICDAGEACVDMVIRTGVVEQAVKRLALYLSAEQFSSEFQVIRNQTVSPIIRMLGNIVTYEDKHTNYVLELGLLPLLRKLFSFKMDPKRSTRIKKEICWVISNITAGTPEHVDQVIDNGFLEILVNSLKNADQLTKVEACWGLCNASMHIKTHMYQAKEVYTAGAVHAFAKFLPTVKSDPKIVSAMLDCLYNFLECGKLDSFGGDNEVGIEIEDSGLIDYIEELQGITNYSVSSSASKIIRDFFYNE
ncbi:importin subunit alpha-6/7 [Nematocida sp. AWRm77]|nr:importin subunit alpha-6/7 [Nematocida sp. AWRm77]